MNQSQIMFPQFSLITEFINIAESAQFKENTQNEEKQDRNEQSSQVVLKRAGVKEIKQKPEELQQKPSSYVQPQCKSKRKIVKNPDLLIKTEMSIDSSPIKNSSQLKPLSPLKSPSPIQIPSIQKNLSLQKTSSQKNCKKNALGRFSEKEREEFINSFKYTVNKDLIKKFGISRHILFKIKNELGLVKDLTYLQKMIQNKQKKPGNSTIYDDNSEEVDIKVEIETQEETEPEEAQKRGSKTKKIKKY